MLTFLIKGCYLGFGQFSLITQMLMAVCYRESSSDHLQKFKQQFSKAQMTRDLELMFHNLEQTLNIPALASYHEHWWAIEVCVDLKIYTSVQIS
jgi:hypothetical protein